LEIQCKPFDIKLKGLVGNCVRRIHQMAINILRYIKNYNVDQTEQNACFNEHVWYATRKQIKN